MLCGHTHNGQIVPFNLVVKRVFERTVGHYIMWHAGVSIAYAESTLTIIRDLGEAGPTIVAGVPRVFEKVLEGAVSKAREAGGLKWKIFRWAMTLHAILCSESGSWQGWCS